MRASEATSELEPVGSPDTGPPTPVARVRRGRWWRGLTGTLAAGLVVLTVIVLAAQVNGLVSASEGPGPFMTVGHVVAASLAVAAQRLADRTSGGKAATAGVTVLALATATLCLFWWG